MKKDTKSERKDGSRKRSRKRSAYSAVEKNPDHGIKRDKLGSNDTSASKKQKGRLSEAEEARRFKLQHDSDLEQLTNFHHKSKQMAKHLLMLSEENQVLKNQLLKFSDNEQTLEGETVQQSAQNFDYLKVKNNYE